jgi:predicted RNA-binding protein with PIN domain
MPTPSPEALLLIDGYNIIGTWSRLCNLRDRHGLEPARQELIESLIDYAALQNFQTRIIFDAQYQKTPASQEKYTAHLSVTFTAWTQTADSYIEKLCATFYRQLSPLQPPRLIVATSDRAQQLTVTGYGAEWMSAQRLASEVECSHKQFLSGKRTARQRGRGGFLFDSLDAQAQRKFQRWRQGKN